MTRECRTCGAPIFFCQFPSGERHPLEPERLRFPEIGAVAYNPAKETGKVLTAEDLRGPAHLWASKGATFHRSHFRSSACASAERVHAEQTSLL